MVEASKSPALFEAEEALKIIEPATPSVELTAAMAQVAIAEQLGRIADAMEIANGLKAKELQIHLGASETVLAEAKRLTE